MTLDMLAEIITSLEDLKPWQRFAVAHVDELIAYLKDQEREMLHRAWDAQHKE